MEWLADQSRLRDVAFTVGLIDVGLRRFLDVWRWRTGESAAEIRAHQKFMFLLVMLDDEGSALCRDLKRRRLIVLGLILLGRASRQ